VTIFGRATLPGHYIKPRFIKAAAPGGGAAAPG